MVWNGWPLARIILLLTGFLYIFMSVQITLFHSRQNFRHWAQWVPVIAAPIIGVLAIIIVFYNLTVLRQLFAILAGVAVLVGLYGFYLHFTGVGERVDGYRVENFLVGPPIVLPVMVTGVSLLGLIAIYWRW